MGDQYRQVKDDPLGNNNTFTGNIADNNFAGFAQGGGGKLTFSGNVANNNLGDGFFIFGSSTLTMKGNTADGNKGGKFQRLRDFGANINHPHVEHGQ